MEKELVEIEFSFPEGSYRDKESLADAIVLMMKEKGSTDHAGYTSIDLLREGLLVHLGKGPIQNYKGISAQEKEAVGKIILDAIQKCNKAVPLPVKNFVFVHPYFPGEGDEVFGGVMAVATYSCVFHVYVAVDCYTGASLEDTVAHELNHTIYYYYHYDDFNNYTLLDEILLEGLAENFREQFFDPKTAPWAGALTKEDAFKILKHSKDILGSRDRETIRNFLFGGGEYRKWTGYSAGYWLVKEFLSGRSASWEEIMKTDPKEFLKDIK